MAQWVKNPATVQEVQETQVQSLGPEDPLEDMAARSSILAWKILRTEEPDGLQSMGLQRVGHNLATKHMSLLITVSRGGPHLPMLIICWAAILKQY